MELEIKPLSEELLTDYLHFFDEMVFSENPGWKACYCYSFHFTGKPEEWIRENNRESVIKLIRENKLRGYLAFSNGTPVGWCNANDRMNYQSLTSHYQIMEETGSRICSLVCFLISPEYRRKGIARKLMENVITDYIILEYDYLEAYPGKGKLSCERQYKGPSKMYEKAGFILHKEFENYRIVRKYLKK